MHHILIHVCWTLPMLLQYFISHPPTKSQALALRTTRGSKRGAGSTAPSCERGRRGCLGQGSCRVEGAMGR